MIHEAEIEGRSNRNKRRNKRKNRRKELPCRIVVQQSVREMKCSYA
jgi:hypothetical protein